MILREGIFQSWLGGDFLRNKLLACLLLHLGFEVQLLKARVWLDDGQTPRWGIGSLRGTCTWLQLVPWRCNSKGNIGDIFLCSVVQQMVHITLYTVYSIYFICHIYMIGYPYSNATDWHQSLLITFKASFNKKTVCFSSLGSSSQHGDKHETWWQISPDPLRDDAKYPG